MGSGLARGHARRALRLNRQLEARRARFNPVGVLVRRRAPDEDIRIPFVPDNAAHAVVEHEGARHVLDRAELPDDTHAAVGLPHGDGAELVAERHRLAVDLGAHDLDAVSTAHRHLPEHFLEGAVDEPEHHGFGDVEAAVGQHADDRVEAIGGVGLRRGRLREGRHEEARTQGDDEPCGGVAHGADHSWTEARSSAINLRICAASFNEPSSWRSTTLAVRGPLSVVRRREPAIGLDSRELPEAPPSRMPDRPIAIRNSAFRRIVASKSSPPELRRVFDPLPSRPAEPANPEPRTREPRILDRLFPLTLF